VSLEQLLALYLPALKAHLTETKRIDPDKAEDLLQTFVSAKFLEQNLPAQADQTRGRFRTFVLTALDHFISDQRRRDAADKRSAERATANRPNPASGLPTSGQLRLPWPAITHTAGQAPTTSSSPAGIRSASM
jgi:hypothetical protein